MLVNVLHIICLVLASVFWAGASVMQFRYQQSIFTRFKNQKFWNPVLSHNTSKKILNWKFDGFHTFQSASILLFCIPIADNLSRSVHITSVSWLNFAIWYIVCGFAWNIPFEWFYENVFTDKKKKL